MVCSRLTRTSRMKTPQITSPRQIEGRTMCFSTSLIAAPFPLRKASTSRMWVLVGTSKTVIGLASPDVGRPSGSAT